MTTTPHRILIVDDEEAARYGMKRALGNLGYEIREAGSTQEAQNIINTHAVDLVILDVNLPGESGLEYLARLQTTNRPPLVIIITAHGSERTAVEAIKIGAYDYLSKPFEIDDLRLVVKNAFETLRLRRENKLLRQRLESDKPSESLLIGTSPAMRRVRELINKVAETDASVLIRGESGTGKELVARAIHEQSLARRPGAFVAVNCAALPSELIESELFGHEKGAFTGASARRRGKFEQADGGTLFLDEIGDMSINVQAKLLRALEERQIERLGGSDSTPVDVRIVSATHRALEEEIKLNRFRADLFYRLCVVTIEVQPLRERRHDIPLLAEAFAQMFADRHGLLQRAISKSALELLTCYEYPGNVRELRNIIERATILAESDELMPYDLPTHLCKNGTQLSKDVQPLKDIEDAGLFKSDNEPEFNANHGLLDVPFTTDFRSDRREFERRYIAKCLEISGGNVTRAAGMLGMHRQSLQHKLRELGLARRYISINTPEEDDT